jgi:hypothetical protein
MILLAVDAAPPPGSAYPAEAHTWRGTTEVNAIREFLATPTGGSRRPVLDLPPGTDPAMVVTPCPGRSPPIVTIPEVSSR